MPRGLKTSVTALAFLLLAIGCQSPAPFTPPVVNVVPSATPTATVTQTPEPAEIATPTKAPSAATVPITTATATTSAGTHPTATPTETQASTATATPTIPATAMPPLADTPTPVPTSTPEPSATATPTPLPSASPTPLAIVVNGSLTYIDSDGNLWLINADGSGKTFLAKDVDPSQSPVWSPAKSRVAFRENKTVNNIPVKVWRVMEVDDLGRYQLIARIQNSEDFAWSSDGRSAIISEPFKGFVEYNISTQRTEDVFDTFGGALDRSPALSPNGKKLVFAHYELSVQYYVGLVRAYDDQIKPVTYDESFTNYFHPVVTLLDAGTAKERNQQFRFMWTQDGKKIVYAVQQSEEAFGSIFATGAIFNTVASGVLAPASTNVDLSASGESVVFSSSQGLMTAPIEGSYTPRMLLEGAPTSPRWSPDDMHVAAIDDRGIIIVSFDGKVSGVIPETKGAVSMAWLPLP